MTGFPTDEVTLTMLIASCKINPDNEQTNLHAFLDMGTRVKTTTELDPGSDEEGAAGAPVYEVEYEKGYEPFSPHDVIVTLAEALLALRVEMGKIETLAGDNAEEVGWQTEIHGIASRALAVPSD